MNIVIRKAIIDDASILATMGWETFEETWNTTYKRGLLEQFLNENYSEQQISKDLSDPVNLHYIAFVENKPAGFVKLSSQQTLGDWITDRCLEICRIYVYKKFQDQKIGKLLMDKCIEVAKAENMESLVLGVWENNHRAVNFYRKFGFEPIGTHEFIIVDQVDTDWVMRKKL